MEYRYKCIRANRPARVNGSRSSLRRLLISMPGLAYLRRLSSVTTPLAKPSGFRGTRALNA